MVFEGSVLNCLAYGVTVSTWEIHDVAAYYDCHRDAIRTWSKIIALKSAGLLRCESSCGAKLSQLPLEILTCIDAYLW